MRSSAHRRVPVDGGGACVEVASSPDTPGRPERWQWHIRLRDDAGDGDAPAGPADAATLVVDLGRNGTGRSLEVAVDAAAVTPDVQVLEVADTQLLQRDERELLALVVADGGVLVEGRHRLGPGDALVLEGDDPIGVTVTGVGGETATLAVVVLRPAGRHGINWVP